MPLSEDKIKCIISLRKMGKSYREIAEQCGVSPNTVMKYVKMVEAQEEAEKTEKHEATEKGNPKVEVLQEDARFVMETTRQRLDPKHPIMTKWVDNVAWWTHLMLDFSKIVLPDIMKLLEARDIDIHNPEVTAKNAVAKFKATLRLAEERAEKILEYEGRIRELEGEVNVLRRENEELRKLMKDYDKALEKLRSFIEDLRGRVGKTLVFIVKYVPQSLSPEARAKYLHVVVPKIKEVWGVEVG